MGRGNGSLYGAANFNYGVLLLESGRLDNWNRTRLFAGAFILTWASGVHYYAGFSFLGVAVYMVWAVLSLGWKAAWRPILMLTAGGSLFGIPYLVFFLVHGCRFVQVCLRSNR